MSNGETATLPDDVRSIVASLRTDQWYPVTGNTLNIGPIIERASAESGESDDVRRHLAMWERFRGRVDSRPLLLARHPQFRQMADDIRSWEAAKAGVRTDEQGVREWFWSVPAAGRIELVKIERERRAAERRFRLAQKKRNVA